MPKSMRLNGAQGNRFELAGRKDGVLAAMKSRRPP